MEDLDRQNYGMLQIIRCNLPNGEQIQLLANNEEIMLLKLDKNSPWERVTAARKEKLLSILNGAVSLTRKSLHF